MDSPNAVEVVGINKVYSSSFGKKKVFALTDLFLSVPAGTIFGLLGPNGAGKTTLIKLLLSITFPDSGSAKILNEDISNIKIKRNVGYLPENHKYPPYLTGGETPKFFGQLRGLDGNVLDKPTDGVDPIGRKEIRDVLVELKNRKKTIFLNSHILSEVELITDNVGILNKGKLLKEGTVREITEKKEEYRLSFDRILSDEVLISINGLKKDRNEYYNLKVNGINELNGVIDSLRNRSILIKEIIPQKNTLEEMFISLIQEADKEEKK